MKCWLLDRLETPKYRKGTKESPELTTAAQMADVAMPMRISSRSPLYRGRPDFNMAALVAELVEGEAVPFLPILRYKPTGLRKRDLGANMGFATARRQRSNHQSDESHE